MVGVYKLNGERVARPNHPTSTAKNSGETGGTYGLWAKNTLPHTTTHSYIHT